MVAFRFRLQRVLEWQQKQCDLAEATMRMCHAAAEQSKRNLLQHREQSIAAERQVISGTPSAADLSSLAYFRVGSARREVRFQGAVAAAEQRLAQERLVLAERQKRLRLLEKLRDRKLEEYQYEAAQELETLSADTYLAKWANRTKRAQMSQRSDQTAAGAR